MNTTRTSVSPSRLLELVRYASESADIAIQRRDAAIREAHRAGASLRDIAAVSGISHMSVKRIIERLDQAFAGEEGLTGRVGFAQAVADLEAERANR